MKGGVAMKLKVKAKERAVRRPVLAKYLKN
jgi:hypothetical protein